MEKPFFLRRGDIVAVEGTGTALTVDGGHTWITQHGDINDYVVRDGVWRSSGPGLILIHALHGCCVTVRGPAVGKARHSRRGDRQPSLASGMSGTFAALRRWFAFA